MNGDADIPFAVLQRFSHAGTAYSWTCLGWRFVFESPIEVSGGSNWTDIAASGWYL